MKVLEFVQDHMITHLLELCKEDLRIDELPPITIMHEGRPAFWLSVYLAHKLRDAPSHANLLDPAVLTKGLE